MTRNFKLFTLFCLVWPVPYLAFLHWVLFNTDKRGILMLPAILILGLGFSIAGHRIGKRDDQSKTRANLAARYILAASIIPTLEAVAWILIWQTDHLTQTYLYLLGILVTFVIVIILSKNSVKGVPKKKLFQ